jgi:predicted dehydrogenase
MPEPIGVAFTGLTHPHIFHRIALLKENPDVQIVGCYDPEPRLRDGVAQRTGLTPFSALEMLLDHPDVQFVIIEGWDPDNPGYVHEAAVRGKAVLVEKPGAPNLPAMRSMLDDLRQHPVPFKIGYQLRHSPVLPHVRQFLADGVLGPVTLARFHAAAPVGGGADPWQNVPGDLGGLMFTDGCHMIDLLVHLLGAPKRVQGMTLTLPAGPPVMAHDFKTDTLATPTTMEIPLGGLMYEDAAAALLDYGDKLVTCDITGWEAHPWVDAWRFEFYGADGVLYVGLKPPSYRLFVRNQKTTYIPGWHTWEATGPDPTYHDELAVMLDRVRKWDLAGNEQWLTDAENVTAVLDAIFQSARGSSAIELNHSVETAKQGT